MPSSKREIAQASDGSRAPRSVSVREKALEVADLAAGQPVAAVSGAAGACAEALPAVCAADPGVRRDADAAGPEEPKGAERAAQVVGDRRGGRDVSEAAADDREEPAWLGERVEWRVVDGVGSNDADTVQLDLLGRHVEADQGHDHLAGGRRAAPGAADAGEDAVDGALQPVAGDVELAAAVPEADQEAGRDLLGGELADLDVGLEAAQLSGVIRDELGRQRRVAVHRKRALVGLRHLKVEWKLRPGGEQLLEQVRGLDGEAPQRVL